jgi:hypothetical protein
MNNCSYTRLQIFAFSSRDCRPPAGDVAENRMRSPCGPCPAVRSLPRMRVRSVEGRVRAALLRTGAYRRHEARCSVFEQRIVKYGDHVPPWNTSAHGDMAVIPCAANASAPPGRIARVQWPPDHSPVIDRIPMLLLKCETRAETGGGSHYQRTACKRRVKFLYTRELTNG